MTIAKDLKRFEESLNKWNESIFACLITAVLNVEGERVGLERMAV